ncbi:hypothetical protein V8G54_031441 [Vigna mungo]|uniref:Uncharacterized protein n=1 Tax=Vigna mungo TaxID=3915 RepID=A0AAQ3RGW9_VIGMU
MLPTRTKQRSPFNRTRIKWHCFNNPLSLPELTCPTQKIYHAGKMFCFWFNPKFFFHHIEIFLTLLNFSSVCTCRKNRYEGYAVRCNVFLQHQFKKPERLSFNTMLCIACNH